MRYFIIGGAGFIGSHLVSTLFNEEPDASIVVYDNFSSGQKWHLDDYIGSRLTIIENDIKDLPSLISAMQGSDHVYHFASNPDIAKAETQPDIDFWQGTLLTQNVLEAMRLTNVSKLTYASGSGVYGDLGEIPAHEDYAPMLPKSTYAASKLAGEALICAYNAMFGIQAQVFRFANVVGPNQTHGVCYDFVHRLMNDPEKLRVLGDGKQSKSYIYVDDVINAMRMMAKKGFDGYEYFNVATEDYLTVNEIADLTVEKLSLEKNKVKYQYTGGDRGWKGDVPIVRFNSQKLRELGWHNQYTSKEAILRALEGIIFNISKRKNKKDELYAAI